jgi:hypothetical protein
MINNKLLAILSDFNKIEQNRLRKFVISPYFNANPQIVTYFDILTEYINASFKKKLNKELIWKKIYSNDNYNDVRFRKLNSELLKLTESYLAQEMYEENQINKATYLLEAVNKRKFEKLYNSSVRTAKHLVEQEPYKDPKFYYNQFEVERHLYDISQSEINRSDKSNSEKIINNLDHFYLAEKMRLYCAIKLRQRFVSHDYKLLFIDEIIEHIELYKYENVPYIHIYYNIYKTIESDNDEGYKKLKELTEKYIDEFSLQEQQQIYFYMLNYCIKRVNSNEKDFLKEFHNLFIFLLNNDLIYESGQLSPWKFKNAVLNALRYGEFKWAENFVKVYSEKLSGEYRENAVSYNLALVYFYQKKYEKVIDQLQSVEYEDIAYNLGSKSMLIAVYYELDEFDVLNSLLDTFKTYLTRHKELGKERCDSYLSLIKFVKKLVKIIPGDLVLINQLKNDIELEKNTSSKTWLLEKVNDLY